jgi:hypothetical protein
MAEVLGIRYIYPGSKFFSIPDPNFFYILYPGSRICIKEFKYLNTKKMVSKLWDLGCSSRIGILDPNPDFLPIPDPGIKKTPDHGSGILDPDPQHCMAVWFSRKVDSKIFNIAFYFKI